MISLRARGEHAPMRAAAASVGAGLIAISPWRLHLRDDEPTRQRLREALAASRVVVTSPVAVRAARRLQPLRARSGQRWFAVGEGTATALRRAGVVDVEAPRRMDSEGLLSLPGLNDLSGDTVGFITAPGGRGVLVPALSSRGARVIRADVYERIPVAPSPRSLARLAALDAPAKLALSSAEALDLVIQALPDPLRERLRQVQVIAASERLADLARAQGFADVVVARSARPADLIAAAAATTTKA
ncbi:uroporphyrinogen-III synthase [Lysobacter arvi]|uniref:Uroporphyrinogen-III synthase n=1 Tax=Lysobacter arvi TaxID=3038776 RepID=A0ABU1CHE9_9GAMM|nr:uroporphyrinogen-III synthase [Lysobacter arvi]MDR0184384.1 uroporphyrinogen-III synthase [Lysobacter arvi]